MKKIFGLLSIIVLVLCVASISSATYTFNDYNDSVKSISTSGCCVPSDAWFDLDFPDSSGGTYSNGVFEYDDHVSNVDFFTITLSGHGDNSSSPIDIYLNLGGNVAKVASKDVANSTDFTLTLDIKNSQLLYNGNYSSALTGGVNLLSFVDLDSFSVGYACHFTHEMTSVDVGVQAVPIPGAVWLLGSGLIGLLGVRKKYKK